MYVVVVANPSAYLNRLLSRFVALDKQKFPDEVVATYLQQLSSPEHVHAICEDYRSSGPGGIDLEHDAEDRKAGRKLKQPVRVLWGKQGPNERFFGHDGMLSLWRNVCENVDGRAVNCGHYIPEELPEEIEREVLTFL